MSEMQDFLNKLLKQKETNQEKKQPLKHMPDNEYAHKEGLITDDFGDITELTEFVNKQLPLANVSDDLKILLLSGKFRMVLTSFYQMRKREKNPIMRQALDDLFIFFYAPFIADLKLTRAKDGFERQLQGHARMTKKKGGGYTLEGIREAGAEEEEGKMYI